MLGAYGSLVGQVEVYPCCVIVEGFGTGIKCIVALEFAPEVINCAISACSAKIVDNSLPLGFRQQFFLRTCP